MFEYEHNIFFISVSLVMFSRRKIWIYICGNMKMYIQTNWNGWVFSAASEGCALSIGVSKSWHGMEEGIFIFIHKTTFNVWCKSVTLFATLSVSILSEGSADTVRDFICFGRVIMLRLMVMNFMLLRVCILNCNVATGMHVLNHLFRELESIFLMNQFMKIVYL